MLGFETINGKTARVAMTFETGEFEGKEGRDKDFTPTENKFMNLVQAKNDISF
jgi:hypothetical protein